MSATRIARILNLRSIDGENSAPKHSGRSARNQAPPIRVIGLTMYLDAARDFSLDFASEREHPALHDLPNSRLHRTARVACARVRAGHDRIDFGLRHRRYR